MASDKEPIIDSKSNMYPPPSLTSLNGSNGKQQNSPAGGASSIEMPTGFYQSQMVQKGKLILPTALWILLIVAGLCFLSLLATLNKTVRTLDTLVELEQAHSKDGDKMNKLVGDNRAEPEAEKLQWMPAALAPDHAESSSWFSMPSWTALEPAKKNFKKPQEDATGSIFGDFFAKSSESAPTGSGSIIFTSAGFDDGQADEGANMIKTLMSQLMGKTPEREPKEKQQSLITANIDKINININSAEEQPTKLRGRKPNDNMHALDQSIDRLVQDLIAGPETPSVLENVLMPPTRPAHIHRRPEPHNHRFHVHSGGPGGPFSPLSSLLFPLELGPNYNRQPEAPMKSFEEFLPLPPMFGKPQQVSEIVILGASESPIPKGIPPPPSPLAPELLNKHHKISEPLNSPYEMIPLGIPMMFGRPEASSLLGGKKERKQHKATEDQLNALDEDLISSLAQGLFQAKESSGSGPKSDSSASNMDSSQSLLSIINEEPERMADRENSSANKKTTKDSNANQVKDLFQMFFGPPPKSKLVVASETSEEIPKLPFFSLIENETKPFSGEEESKREPEVKEDKSKLASGPVFFATSSSSSPSDQKEDKEILDSLLGSLFTSAQFGKDEQPMKVEAQSSGNKDTESSTSAPEVKASKPIIVVTTPLKPTDSLNPKESDFSTTTASIKTEATTQGTTSTTPSPLFELTDILSDFSDGSSERPILISSNNIIESPTKLPSDSKEEVPSGKPVVSSVISTLIDAPPSSTEAPLKAIVSSTPTNNSTSSPFKGFLQKADDFIERNIVNLKNLLSGATQ